MNEHYQVIAAFIIRMGMYISSIDKNNIMSFVTGYELDKQFFFSERIKKFIENKDISTNSLGIIEQIQKYANLHHIEWNTAFIQIGLSIVAEEDDRILHKFKIQNRIRGVIHRIEFSTEDLWIQDWLSFCSSKEKWFNCLWSKDELDIINSIDHLVKNYRNHPYNKETFSEELLQLKEVFEKV